MKKQGMLTVLVAAVVALLSASPSHAWVWPEGRSVILFDGDGFETECVDFSNADVATLFFAERAVPAVSTENPEDAGRIAVSFVLPNGNFGGLYRARNTYVDCSCGRRGTPRYQVQGMPVGEATCGCTATYRGVGMGNTIRTEPLLGVELGAGTNCDKAYQKVVLRPRLLDRWNVDRLPNR